MDIENAKSIRVRDILALNWVGIMHFCTDSLDPDESVFMTIRCDNDGNYNLSALTNYFLDQVVTDITYPEKRNTLIIEVENSNPYNCYECKYYCNDYCKFIPDSEYDEKIEGPREPIKHDNALKGCECWCDRYVSGLYRSEGKE